MQFVSTRNANKKISFSNAILDCIPEDGGLYVPAYEENLRPWILYMDENTTFPSIAGALTSALIKEEFSPIICEAIATRAFPFSPELTQLDDKLFVLDLSNGPTGSHKDFGISYLISCLEHILLMQDKSAIVVSVTTGEIGASIVSALKDKSRVKGVLLYPKGKIRGFSESDCVWNGGNIYPVQVNGTEEDCFRLASEIYSDHNLVQRYGLTLCNTTNIGRLLPQTFFYMYAFSRLKNKVPGDIYYSVTSGNYGNLVAGLYSWKFSLPVNGFITDCSAALSTDTMGKCCIPDSIIPLSQRATANAVRPSNLERLEEIFFTNPAVLKGLVFPADVSEKATGEAHRELYKKYGTIVSPETASAYAALKIRHDLIQEDDGTAILIQKEHPAFRADKVQHYCGEIISMPENLQELYVERNPIKSIDVERNALVNILHEIKD